MAPGIQDSLSELPAAVLTEEETSSTKRSRSRRPLSLIHHSLVTSDMDALKFHAAASLQLCFSPYQDITISSIADSDSDLDAQLLITSPYNSPLHLLNLQTLDPHSRLLAQALTILRPVRADYATAPYADSFNWPSVFAFLRDLSTREGYTWSRTKFYVVVFRSTLLADADADRLHELDARSHQEAVASGGLLKYWFGTKNARRENLATCVWRSREDAHRGGTGPWHRKARGAAREMYEKIVFTTMELVVGDEVGEWSFAEWAG
ncbi:uncharacterized protein NFIA_015470 [Aspergillus fischeri NRRL 181]|uniref:Uncharacterized protein n=1 Tax=Neosartorya fischeri (strain ATCC 1020 / DSM 3700 / CBS 544.65 / FGSC A1164 / JCM 1740 / NRRL 181 / WB 181) TaxID=331117 RepID=A1D361_NEOFI|nr:conserved hypothetical protein [Aspergillus fischeri NRRL 181]EAW22854.1 conserved hypothetical protein [Aspergillus fischeri NRRL 181]